MQLNKIRAHFQHIQAQTNCDLVCVANTNSYSKKVKNPCFAYIKCSKWDIFEGLTLNSKKHIKGSIQREVRGVKTDIIQTVLIFTQPLVYIFYFKGTPSWEEQKTTFFIKYTPSAPSHVLSLVYTVQCTCSHTHLYVISCIDKRLQLYTWFLSMRRSKHTSFKSISLFVI